MWIILNFDPGHATAAVPIGILNCISISIPIGIWEFTDAIERFIIGIIL